MLLFEYFTSPLEVKADRGYAEDGETVVNRVLLVDRLRSLRLASR